MRTRINVIPKFLLTTLIVHPSLKIQKVVHYFIRLKGHNKDQLMNVVPIFRVNSLAWYL